MNILIMHDEKNEEINKFVIEFIEISNDISYAKKVKCITKVTQKCKYDICMIVSNDIIEIKKYVEKLKKIDNIIIITSNLEAKHVVECISITADVCYLKKDIKTIIDKMLRRINESEKA